MERLLILMGVLPWEELQSSLSMEDGDTYFPTREKNAGAGEKKGRGGKRARRDSQSFRMLGRDRTR